MAESSKSSKQDKPAQNGAKEKIVKAALREFSENGLAGARVDRIASEAGVNKAMIYYYFSSKENLYREMIRERLSARMSILWRNLEGQQSLDAVLKQTLDLHGELFLERPEIIKILLRELANPESEIVDTITGIIKESGLPNELAKRLNEGVKRGEYRPVNVRQAVISLIAMSIGYYLMSPLFEKVWQIGHQPTFVGERKTAIADLFMNGVKVR